MRFDIHIVSFYGVDPMFEEHRESGKDDAMVQTRVCLVPMGSCVRACSPCAERNSYAAYAHSIFLRGVLCYTIVASKGVDTVHITENNMCFQHVCGEG